MQTAFAPDAPQMSDAHVLDTMRRLEAAGRCHVTRHDGRKIVWRVWGNGRPLLALHGGYGSWNHYLRLIPLLSPQIMVICPDMPGYGGSDLPLAGNHAEAIAPALAAALPAVFALENLSPGAIDVMGFSFGAAVAGLLCQELARPASQMPCEIAGQITARRLVLLGPPGLGIPLGKVRGAEKLTPGLGAADRARIHAANLARVMLARDASVDALTVHLQDSNVQRARMRGKEISRSAQLRDALAIRPVEAVAASWGSADPYLLGRSADYVAVLQGLYPELSLLIQQDVGHWVQHEAAAATAAFVNTFLADADPRPAR